jgi:hypothetical protein
VLPRRIVPFDVKQSYGKKQSRVKARWQVGQSRHSHLLDLVTTVTNFASSPVVMSVAPRRTAHAETILGPDLHQKLADTKVLLVGAGGIGCELCETYFSFWHCG